MAYFWFAFKTFNWFDTGAMSPTSSMFLIISEAVGRAWLVSLSFKKSPWLCFPKETQSPPPTCEEVLALIGDIQSAIELRHTHSVKQLWLMWSKVMTLWGGASPRVSDPIWHEPILPSTSGKICLEVCMATASILDLTGISPDMMSTEVDYVWSCHAIMSDRQCLGIARDGPTVVFRFIAYGKLETKTLPIAMTRLSSFTCHTGCPNGWPRTVSMKWWLDRRTNISWITTGWIKKIRMTWQNTTSLPKSMTSCTNSRTRITPVNFVHSVGLCNFELHVLRMRSLPSSPDAWQITWLLASVFSICFPWQSAVFYSITGKRTPDNIWKMTNTPRWEGLWEDLVSGGRDRVLDVCIHAADLSILPVAGNLTWLIEFSETWSWFPLWVPGKMPGKYVQPAIISSQVVRSNPVAAGNKIERKPVYFQEIEGKMDVILDGSDWPHEQPLEPWRVLSRWGLSKPTDHRKCRCLTKPIAC